MDEKTFDALARGVGTELGLPRRAVLRAVGAGVPLLGMLLSTGTSEEAEAREGAAGGRLGGRRGKNRRGRDKNRNNGGNNKGNKGKKKNDKPPGLGSPGWIYVRMVVENLTNADIDLEGTALYEEMQGKICRLKDLRTIHPTEAVTFAPGDNNGFPTSAITVLLNGKYGVEAAQEQPPNSEFPVVWAYSGIQDSNIEGCHVGANYAVFNRKMGVGQKLSFTMEGQKFELLRENDIDNARLFRLRVLA